MKRQSLLGLFSVVLAAVSSAASGGIMTPQGLNTGDQFRIIFVTSTATAATSPDIGFYDSFVRERATHAGLNTYQGTDVTWYALASTPDVGALERVPASSAAPLYATDYDTRIADDGAALWNTVWTPLLAPLSLDESGVSVGSTLVWTGTSADGVVPGGELGGGTHGMVGMTEVTSTHWVSWTPSVALLTEEHPVYAVSEVLTVPDASSVPEPGTLVMFLGGTAIIAAWRRRRGAA